MEKDFGVFTDSETIKYERLLPGSLEQVWACLTESEHKAKWLAGGDVEPKVGGKVTHNFNHESLSDHDEVIPEKYADIGNTSTSTGKVTQYKPYTLLGYTWDEGDEGISEVIFELSKENENQVLLILTHKRIPDNKDFKIGLGAGWHTHLNILRDILEEKSPKGFWKVHMDLEEEYIKLI